ncbi:unnamed protein product [Camellia sinensis]
MRSTCHLKQWRGGKHLETNLGMLVMTSTYYHKTFSSTNQILSNSLILLEVKTNDPIAKFCLNYDCEHINGCVDHTQFGPTPGDQDQDQDPLFGCNNLSSGLNALPAVDVGEEENDDDIGGEYSSATTTTTTRLTKRKGGDRSRTLVSETKGRGRMKEKLYALSALVPNITKMDKASIVGDAVEYLQELQMQARKLRAEIAGRESSLTEGDKHQQGIVENTKNIQFICPNHPICKNIMQMDMIQVEEGGFYVRVECNKGQGVASSLYKAIEYLTRFNVQSSNLATLSERFILTFTIKLWDFIREVSSICKLAGVIVAILHDVNVNKYCE